MTRFHVERMKAVFKVVLAFLLSSQAQAQIRYDSVAYDADSSEVSKLQCYNYEGRTLCYAIPKYLGFVTQVPRTLSITFKETCRKKSLTAFSAIATSTLLLLAFDQNITDGCQHFSTYINLDRQTDYKNVISFKLGSSTIPVYQAPLNVNTAIYSLGEGFTSIALSGGMFAYGKIMRDNRALQTASQIVQSQLTVGIITQTLKRISGRESPRVSTAPSGVWRPFASFSNFQKHTSRYDAFPSGHLATMMATVTVLVSNYPEKKWLKPVSYALMSLVGFSMINNGVHWSSEYPLALGIGYACAKASVNMNRLMSYRTNYEKNFHKKKRK